jgi:type II secretory pathway component PulJ
MTASHANEDGFALFEAIVAIALASLALAAVYRTVGDAVRASATVRENQSALALARTQLNAIAADGTIRSGQSHGTYAGGLRWRLSVATLSERPIPDSVQPFWVVLESLDHNDKLIVRLETAKLAQEVR